MKNEFSFLTFTQRHRLLLGILLLLPIISIVVFCFVFHSKLYNESVWASLVTGIFTYLGSTFLGVFVYYHSWMLAKQQEKNEELNIDVRIGADFNDNYFVPYLEDAIGTDFTYKMQAYEKHSSDKIWNANYLYFKLTNNNPYVSFNISVSSVYFINERNKLCKIERYKLKATRDPAVYVDYKEGVECYVGCSNELLRCDYYQRQKYNNWFIVLKIQTSKHKTKYLILDYVLGQTLGVHKAYLNEEIYNKRIKENGCPIRLTKYNKQFFKL